VVLFQRTYRVLKLARLAGGGSTLRTPAVRGRSRGEAKIRRMVDAQHHRDFSSRVEGEIIEANDAFLKMMGYDRG